MSCYFSLLHYLLDLSCGECNDKSILTLFTTDPKQAKDHPRIIVDDSEMPISRDPKILGVH